MRKVVLFLVSLASAIAAENRPLTPEEAQKCFQLSPGLKIELVAAEPLVVDPVDMIFDEDGRLYVAEMIDYPFQANPPLGRVRLLTDTDGDGRMDKSDIFCDGLAWPTSVACWKGGVFVAAAPSIWYLKDTDGDGKADVKQEYFTGFGKQNVQALLNNIKWSMENCFVCASGPNGGTIKSLLKPELAPLNVNGRDFRFTPDGNMQALTGGGQFGHSLDDAGNRFICNNSIQARHVVIEDRYLARNKFAPIKSAVASIAVDGDAGPVFRSSPVEQWRVTRTQMRITGESQGIVEFGGKVSGYFTSATGITVYRGDAMGKQYTGNLFIGDVASNLVHRKTLTPDGSTFKTARVEQGGEFLTSSDTMFRPVNFANGPDGGLYICDMPRECIEHPISIPESLKKNLNMKSCGLGRIWRVSARTAEKVTARKMSALGAEQLAAHFRGNSWTRETASRLLCERQDKSVVPLLEANAKSYVFHTEAELWALDGLQSLNPDVFLAIGGPIRLAERHWRGSPKIKSWLLSFNPNDARSRFQLALTLGEIDEPEATEALARLAVHAKGDPWLRSAILTARCSNWIPILSRIDSSDTEFLHDLGYMIGVRNNAPEIAAAVGATKSWSALAGLAEGRRKHGKKLAEEYADVFAVFREAEVVAKDSAAPENRRLEAIQLLTNFDWYGSVDAFFKIIESDSPERLRSAAIRALSNFSEPSIGERLIVAWSALSPALRSDAGRGWFAPAARLELLMKALEEKKILPKAMPLDVRKQLRAHFKKRSTAFFEEDETDRKAVVARYKQALTLIGDSARGKIVFQNACATCHRLGGAGNELGPDIETVAHRTPEDLLEHILNPNREVAPQFVSNTITLNDGRVLEGILSSQNASSVTLKRANSETNVLSRAEIKTMLTSSTSPMPEGLEATVNYQQMADLIEFLRSPGRK